MKNLKLFVPIIGIYYVWKSPVDDVEKYDLLCQSTLWQCVIAFLGCGTIVNYLM